MEGPAPPRAPPGARGVIRRRDGSRQKITSAFPRKTSYSWVGRATPMIGQVDWDGKDAGNEHVGMRASAAARGQVLRTRLVHVRDDSGGRDFLARISDGPFFPSSKDGTSEVLA